MGFFYVLFLRTGIWREGFGDSCSCIDTPSGLCCRPPAVGSRHRGADRGRFRRRNPQSPPSKLCLKRQCKNPYSRQAELGRGDFEEQLALDRLIKFGIMERCRVRASPLRWESTRVQNELLTFIKTFNWGLNRRRECLKTRNWRFL